MKSRKSLVLYLRRTGKECLFTSEEQEKSVSDLFATFTTRADLDVTDTHSLPGTK